MFAGFFGFDATNDMIDLNISTSASSSMFLKTVKQCCDSGNRSFFDEKMPDGIVVHQFIKRIGVNPVTGDTAVAVAVLSISKPSEGATYADIARALAADSPADFRGKEAVMEIRMSDADIYSFRFE